MNKKNFKRKIKVWSFNNLNKKFHKLTQICRKIIPNYPLISRNSWIRIRNLRVKRKWIVKILPILLWVLMRRKKIKRNKLIRSWVTSLKKYLHKNYLLVLFLKMHLSTLILLLLPKKKIQNKVHLSLKTKNLMMKKKIFWVIQEHLPTLLTLIKMVKKNNQNLLLQMLQTPRNLILLKTSHKVMNKTSQRLKMMLKTLNLWPKSTINSIYQKKVEKQKNQRKMGWVD